MATTLSQNLILDRAADQALTFRLTDKATNQVIDLSEATVRFIVNEKNDSAASDLPLLDLDFVEHPLDSKWKQLIITTDDIALLKKRQCFFMIHVVFGGRPSTPVRGTVEAFGFAVAHGD